MTLLSLNPHRRASHRPRLLFGVTLAFSVTAAAGCGELREDADYMCVVPVDCSPEDVDTTCVEGDYPADTPLTIRVWVEASPNEVSKEECWAEITDEFELTVYSRWRERDRQDNLELTAFDCESPALAEGTWTIVSGDEEVSLRVPREQAAVACTPMPEW